MDLVSERKKNKREEKPKFNNFKLHVFRKISLLFWKLSFLTWQALEINKVQFRKVANEKKKLK